MAAYYDEWALAGLHHHTAAAAAVATAGQPQIMPYDQDSIPPPPPLPPTAGMTYAHPTSSPWPPHRPEEGYDHLVMDAMAPPPPFYR